MLPYHFFAEEEAPFYIAGMQGWLYGSTMLMVILPKDRNKQGKVQVFVTQKTYGLDSSTEISHIERLSWQSWFKRIILSAIQ